VLEDRTLLSAGLLLDLNGPDQSGTDFSTSFTEDLGPVSITAADAQIQSSGDTAYIADGFGNQIVALDLSSGTQQVVSSGGNFKILLDIEFDNSGDLIVGSSQNSLLLSVDVSDGTQTIIPQNQISLLTGTHSVAVASNGTVFVGQKFGIIEVPGTESQSSIIASGGTFTGIDVDSNNNLYFVGNGKTLFRSDAVTGAVTTVNNNNSVLASAFIGVSVSDTGAVFLTDDANDAVWRFDVSTTDPLTGTFTQISSGGLLAGPLRHIAVDSGGDLVVTVDIDGGRVVGIDSVSRQQTLIASGTSDLIVSPQGLTIAGGSASGNLAWASVTLTAIPDGTDESLAANTAGTNISGVYDSGTGSLSLTGTDSVANYQQVLRSVTYNNASQDPSVSPRVIQFVVNDGSQDSNVATATVNVNGANDQPFLVNAIADVEANEDDPDGTIDVSATFDDVDADDTLAVSVSDNTNAGLVAATIVGGDLVLDYLPDQSGTAEITVRATDGSGLFVEDTFTVSVLSAQDQLQNLIVDVGNLGLNGGNTNALTSKLNSAIQKLNQGKITPAVNQLNSLINQINAFIQIGKLSASEGQPLIAAINDAIRSASTTSGAGLIQAASQTSASPDGAPVARADELLTGAIGVFLDDAAATITADQQARFRDSIDTLNVAFGAYGVTLVEVAAAADAVIVVEVAATSEGGTAADGVLGYAVAGHITLLSGWNWYAGADPLLVGSDQYDLQTIMTHELGHSAGLAHSGDGGSVMYRMLATSEIRRSVTATDLTLLEAEATSTPQSLLAAPRPDAQVNVQSGSVYLVSTQFPVPSPHLFADSDRGTATATVTVEVLNLPDLSGVVFDTFAVRSLTTHWANTTDGTIQRDRLFKVLALPPADVLGSQFADSGDYPMDLDGEETSRSGDPLSAENLDRVFAESWESLADELLLGGMTSFE
jgi:sugar lactone lactonase YvrE